jgi:tRNA G18 (ribose-2'-O)-methylase SpoU
MSTFAHQRHKPPTALERPHDLILACAPLRSNVNLSHIIRTAGCCGIGKVICCGNPKILTKIAREGADTVDLEIHRSLPPVLKRLKAESRPLVGLEQTTGSRSLYDFHFPRNAVLVIGNERLGLTEDVLSLLDHTVEIPVYGLPYSYNVATATAMALYEYCRQYPRG